MTTRLRALLGFLTALATIFLVNCGGGYTCQASFGGSCTPSGSGISSTGGGTGGTGGGGGGGGGGGSSATVFAFAVDQGGTIDGYTLNASAGTIAPSNGYLPPVIPTNSGGVGMVIAQSQYLYAGFGSTDQIYGWSISSSGVLTAITGSPFSASFLSDYIGGVGQANMTTDPAGTMLFISDAIYNEIYVFTIGTGGVLTPVTGSPFSVPFPPMNLSTDGLGKYLYAIDGDYTTHTGSQIAAFVIGTGGVLTPVQGSPFTGSKYAMWQVTGEPTGQFLIGTSGKTAYYSGADDDNLYVFSIMPSGSNPGAITPVTGSPFATVYSPFNIAVQQNKSGASLYSFSFNDAVTAFNPIEGYQINSTTGTLTPDVGSPFSGLASGSWGAFDQTGAYLFVYSSYLDSSTNAQVTQLAPMDVGAGGALTQPVSTLTLQTPGFWAVTDPQ
ncbi:MAG: hypothetical protein WB762_01860 [Candidatus Sulfotelmatobacter sp.]